MVYHADTMLTPKFKFAMFFPVQISMEDAPLSKTKKKEEEV